MLKPDVDLGRTVGSFTTLYPLALHCSAGADIAASHRFEEVHDALGAVPHYGIGYGLLRHMYGPTLRRLEAAPRAEILFGYAGTMPELSGLIPEDAAVQFDTDTALPVREPLPGLGHAIELRGYRSAGALHLDWWYDSRRIEPSIAESLAQEFTSVLMDLTRDAVVEDEMESANEELALVDLSSSDLGLGDANARH